MSAPGGLPDGPAAFGSGPDVLAAVGRSLGVSGWRTLSARRVAAWAEAVGPGAVRADGAPVPGGLLVGLVPGLLDELLCVAGYRREDYGLDRVRFPGPLPVGAAVRARGTLLRAAVHEQALRAVVELGYERAGDGPAPCVAAVTVLLRPA